MTLYRASFLRIILLVSSRFGEALDTLQSPIQPRTDIYLSGKKTKEKC